MKESVDKILKETVEKEKSGMDRKWRHILGRNRRIK